MICYLANCSTDYALYIGQKAMYALEGGVDFRSLPFHFTMRFLNIYAGESIAVKPGQSKMYPMVMKKNLEEF